MISKLYINTSSLSHVGLFGRVGSAGEIRNLGLEDGSVKSSVILGPDVGILAGGNAGTITACYSTGSVEGTGGSANVGGIMGYNGGLLQACYSTGNVLGGAAEDANVCGLVGQTRGGTVNACYSGTATGGTPANVGALVGYGSDSPQIAFSYFDTEISDLTSGIGSENDPCPMDKTTIELQSLTGPTGIYEDWSVDVDGNTITQADQVVWSFCSANQYPVFG